MDVDGDAHSGAESDTDTVAADEEDEDERALGLDSAGDSGDSGTGKVQGGARKGQSDEARWRLTGVTLCWICCWRVVWRCTWFQP